MSAAPTVTHAEAPASGESKRAVIVEVAIVLVIAFGASTLVAIRDLAASLTGLQPTASQAFFGFPTIPWLNAIYDVLLWATVAAPAALAVLLVVRSGAGVARLGIRRPRWRDGAIGLGLALGYLVLSGAIGALVLHFTGRHTANAARAFGPLNRVLSSLNAGILEETVVLTYVVHRLEAAKLPTLNAAAISVLVRVSYHLYAGPYVLPVLLFGMGQTLYFVRARRLLPLVVAHAGYDLVVVLLPIAVRPA
jgi:hypothetical protein